METILEAIERLRTGGYTLELSATDEALLRCPACDETIDPHVAVIDETVRFEGESDPDDEAILLAISTPCGHRGYYTAAYGPDMPANDVAVFHALTSR